MRVPRFPCPKCGGTEFTGPFTSAGERLSWFTCDRCSTAKPIIQEVAG